MTMFAAIINNQSTNLLQPSTHPQAPASSKSLMLDFILSNLAKNKQNDEPLFIPVYTCKTKDKQGLTWVEITTDELSYAQNNSNSYELSSVTELNSALSAEGVIEGILLTTNGLYHFDYKKYSYVSYLNDETLVDSFFDWIVKVQGFPVDGFIVKGLNKYITSMKQLDLFHDHYDSVFKKNSEYLTQCLIDIIQYYKNGVELPNYCQYHH